MEDPFFPLTLFLSLSIIISLFLFFFCFFFFVFFCFSPFEDKTRRQSNRTAIEFDLRRKPRVPSIRFDIPLVHRSSRLLFRSSSSDQSSSASNSEIPPCRRRNSKLSERGNAFARSLPVERLEGGGLAKRSMQLRSSSKGEYSNGDFASLERRVLDKNEIHSAVLILIRFIRRIFERCLCRCPYR